MVLLIISVMQGNFLRKIGYFRTPEPYVILDEHTNVWHGLSIRKTGIPTAWSILSVYKENSLKYGSGGGIEGFLIKPAGINPALLGYREVKSPVTAVFEKDLGKGVNHIPLVQPYLDHPPLAGIVLSLGVSKSASTFSEVSDFDMRRSATFIAIITQVLIAILAYQLTKSYFVGVASSFIYATAPSFLLLSRYAQLENVLTPLLLATLILLLFINGRREKLTPKLTHLLITLSGILAGLCALTKLSGWIAVALGIFLLIHWKFDRKKIAFFAVPSVLIGLLYFLWGLYLSPKLFVDLFLYQGITRSFIGSLNLLTSLVRVNILNFPFDGWWIGGFISLVLIPKDKKFVPLYASVILILISALFLGGANYSWYFIPLIPFMCISISMFFNGLIKKPNVLNILLTFFIFVSSSFYWGWGVFYASASLHNYQQPFTLYRAVFLAFLLIALSISKLKKLKMFKIYWPVFVGILLISLVLLNHHGMYYILDNWGKFPSLYTPGTFDK